MRYIFVFALLLFTVPASAYNDVSCTKTAKSLDEFSQKTDALLLSGKNDEAKRLHNNIQRDVENFTTLCLADCPPIRAIIREQGFISPDNTAFQQIYRKRKEFCP